MTTLPTCEPSAYIELIKAVPGIVTAVTAVVGVLVARAGLNKWHMETIGKRKAELAEQALTAFYEAQDVFKWVRAPVMFGNEGASRTPSHGETPAQQQQLNSYFVPIERLTAQKSLFAKLQTLQYSFAAHFGESARAPFAEINDVHTSIYTAASVLIQITRQGGGHNPNDGRAGLTKTLWGDEHRPDDLDAKMTDAVAAIVAICRPVLETKGKRSP